MARATYARNFLPLQDMKQITAPYRISKSTRHSAFIPSRRWAAYASAGLATAFGSAGAAEAEIHYSGLVRAVLTAGTHSTTERSFALEGAERLVFDFGRF